MRRNQSRTMAGFVTGLLVAALIFALSPWRPGAGNGPDPTAPLELVGEIKTLYPDDRSVRAELFNIARQDLPAYAAVVHLDHHGTWSRLYLGPFSQEEEAVEAVDRVGRALEMDINFKPAPPRRGPDSEPQADGGPVLVELAYLLNDDEIYDELAIPHRQNIYAFARTAQVVGGESPEGFNRIYLGPFPNESEARSILARLSDWDLADDYLILPLEND